MFSRFCALVLILASPALSLASKQVTIDSFQQFYQHAEQAAKQQPANNILLVFDIDDTLLKLQQPLGGVSWWDWQSDLLKRKPNSPLLEAHSFQGLLKIQGMLFALSKSQPVEANQPELFKKLQQQGFKTLILTARGAEFRNMTETALKENDYNVTPSALGKPGTIHEYMPYTTSHLNTAGLTADNINYLKNHKPRLVSYGNGILFVAGQNKGLMLKLLLKRLDLHFKTILFLDDSKSNIDEMTRSYSSKADGIQAFYYTQMAQEKENFHKEIPAVTQAWQNFKTSYEKVFGTLPR